MDRQKLLTTLDEAAKVIASLPSGRKSHWISFLLEAIEEEVGVGGLRMVQALLDERFEKGMW